MGARSEQLKGVRFGAYEVVGLVGHGATASVFEAVHVGLDKPVALKLLHEHLAADSEITSRFLREGRVAARLDHPNIVAVLDVGTDRGVPYLVMELLRGTDLRTLLADVRILDVEHALGFLLPIVAGLAHAHDAGVIHRDIKPANVFLSRDSRGEVVPTLVDFGLSKVLYRDGGASSAPTASEVVAGTALYMAPEQTLGMKHVVPASDQYSLAAVLYEVLTGEPPFTGDGVYSLLESIRSAPLRPPSLVHGGIPEELDAVVLRAMNRDPAKRWPSMRAFGRELGRFAGGAMTTHLERELASSPRVRVSASSRAPGDGDVAKVAAEAETRSEEVRASGSLPAPRVEPLPCAAGASPFHIKGVSYRGFMRHVTRTVGLDRFVGELGDDLLRAFVRQPFLASARYDVLPYVPLFAVLARLQRVPMDMLVRAATAAQVKYDAKTTYKSILTTTRPGDIADRIGRFNEQVYDFGSYRARTLGDRRVAVEFEHIPAYLEPWFAPMHISYAEESLRLAGAKDVVTASQPPVESGTQGGYALRTYRAEIGWR